MSDLTHHDDAGRVLADFGPVNAAKILTALTRAGLVIGELKVVERAVLAEARACEAVCLLNDLLGHRNPATDLVSARALLGRRWAREAVERAEGSKLQQWREQIEASRGAA